MSFLEENNLAGIAIAVVSFLIIALFHPLVIKAEYYFGVKSACWFGVLGVIALAFSLMTSNLILSSMLGVLGCSSLWSILEVFHQRERVRKGWFPKNPKRM